MRSRAGFRPQAFASRTAAERVQNRSPTPRRSLILWLVSFLCALAGSCSRSNAPPPSPDLARARPARVVTLAPNLTEIVFAVGAGGTLVGVSEYSDYPPEARSLPRVGGLEVSAERVVSLHPDLVLATPEGNAKGPVAALEAAGVSVLAVPGGSLAAVIGGIRLVGRRLGRAGEADRLAADLERRREAVRKRVARSKRRPRAVLIVWPDPPQAAGGGTFLNDLLTEAGAENLLAGREGWPLVSPEWLVTAPIEVLVVPDSEETRPAYQRAFATGPLSRGAAAAARVVRIDESVLTRPGPRIFDALERLAGELFR